MSALWIFAAAGIAMAVLAARTYLIERREGLRRSPIRGLGVPAVAAALIALVWFAPDPAASGSHDPGPAPPARSGSATGGPAPDPKVQALEAKIAGLVRDREAIERQIAALREELPRPTGAPPPPVVWAPRVPSQWPFYVAGLLVIGCIVLLLLGDPSLLLWRRRRPAQPASEGTAPPATVARVVDLAWAGRWAAALDAAGKLQIEQLSKLEVLDLLFLRAFCHAMSVSSPEPSADKLSSEQRRDRLASAASDLARLLELGPHMAEASWLLGHVSALQGEWQAALDRFQQARPDLDDLPFVHNESVCLLHLAEQRMANADNEGATQLFDRVSQLGMLADRIPAVTVTHRILTVRGHIKAGRLGAAADGLERIRQVEGLGRGASRAVAAVCDVYALAIRYRSGKLAEALEAVVDVLARWAPDKLPPADDEIADEFLQPAVAPAALRMPAELHRALYFFEAVLRMEVAAAQRRPLDLETVERIATALLRALQFEPRHRDVLAALAALYLAYRKERTARALDWLESALSLGVRSRAARTLFLEIRRAENERKEVLAVFRSASTRFLSDPALGTQVRTALIEELGRFHEFRPVVFDLRDLGALELPAASDVTIAGLHERAAFVAGVAGELIQKLNGAIPTQLLALHRELQSLASGIDASAKQITVIERAVLEQLGALILR